MGLFKIRNFIFGWKGDCNGFLQQFRGIEIEREWHRDGERSPVGRGEIILFRVQLKCDGRRWRTGGEVKGKLANAVGSQYPSHYLGTCCIQHYYRWCAHLGCQQSTELTSPTGRFKWTRSVSPRKTKSGFCACAITFQLASTALPFPLATQIWRTVLPTWLYGECSRLVLPHDLLHLHWFMISAGIFCRYR